MTSPRTAHSRQGLDAARGRGTVPNGVRRIEARLAILSPYVGPSRDCRGSLSPPPGREAQTSPPSEGKSHMHAPTPRRVVVPGDGRSVTLGRGDRSRFPGRRSRYRWPAFYCRESALTPSLSPPPIWKPVSAGTSKCSASPTRWTPHTPAASAGPVIVDGSQMVKALSVADELGHVDVWAVHTDQRGSESESSPRHGTATFDSRSTSTTTKTTSSDFSRHWRPQSGPHVC